MPEQFPFKTTESDKFVFVPRTGDTVMPMRLASEDQRDSEGKRFAYSTTDSTNSEAVYESKTVTDDLLTDDRQEELSQQLDLFARESADLPLRSDTVFAKQHGQIVEGQVTDYKTTESPSGSRKYGKFIDAAGNKSDVAVEALSLDAQAELAEQKNKPFLVEAKRLVEQSRSLDDDTKRVVIGAYLASVDRAVNAGLVIASDDNEPFDSHQIEQLFDKFTKALNVFEDPTKKTSRIVMQNIPRSNGLRDAFTALLENEGTASVFEQAMKDKYEKEQPEAVDVKQPLGYLAVAGVDVVSPSEATSTTSEIDQRKIDALREVQGKISELTADVSSDDLRRLVQYATATTEDDKAIARKWMSEPLRGDDDFIAQYSKLSDERTAIREG